MPGELNLQKVGNIQLILDSLNNHKPEADEGNSSSSDLLQFRPSSGPKANPKSLVNERRSSSKFRAIFRSTGFVKNLIPNNINDFEFIYEVNFNAGRVKLTFIRYILERKKLQNLHFVIVSPLVIDTKLLSAPTKAEVFNNLIDELKKIDTSKYRSKNISSLSHNQFGRWNTVLSKLIILTSFSKANQEKFWQREEKFKNRTRQYRPALTCRVIFKKSYDNESGLIFIDYKYSICSSLLCG